VRIPSEQDVLEHFAALSAPESLDVVSRLRALQAQKRVVQLASIKRRLVREAPTLIKSTGFDECFAVMTMLPPAVVAEIAGLPSFGRWCAVTQRMLAYEAHLRLPDGQLTRHLLRLGSFALGGSARVGEDTELQVVFDPSARLFVAPLSSVARGDASLSSARATVRLSNNSLSILHCNRRRARADRLRDASDGASERVTSETLPLERAASLPGSFEFAVEDHLLARVGAPLPVEEIGPVGLEAWRTFARGATGLIRDADEIRFEEVTRFVTHLLPVVPRGPQINASSTSSDSFGAVYLSLSDAATGAEILVHELEHHKLHAVEDLYQIASATAASSRYYSPWRDDSRPVSGLVHGLCAFTAVAELWERFCDVLPSIERDRARYECTRRRVECLSAIASLEESGGLSDFGRDLVDTFGTRARKIREFDSAKARVGREREAHSTKWFARFAPDEGWRQRIEERCNARLALVPRSNLPLAEVARFIPAGAGAAQLLATLGASAVRPNRLSLGFQTRTDPTRDFLGTLAVNRPDAFASARTLTEDIDESDGLYPMLTGHLAYIAQDYEIALQRYATWIGQCEDNLDAWIDFAFALRHLNHSEADVILFHPLDVVRLWCTYEIPGGIRASVETDTNSCSSLVPGRVLEFLRVVRNADSG
jgi:HEXXH motif-containing protein